MQVEINSRGNGACPLCNSSGNCRLQDILQDAMMSFFEEDDPMEVVVYSCPKFQEKTESE
jgi:NADH dehydrogenase/NADH:ubiquinone oxidoreductase subunit G